MISCLPMYDWTELRNSHEKFWLVIRDALASEGIAAPNELSLSENDETYWLSPQLLLGQTCGYPYATSLKDKVRYVATPHYKVAGCNGAQYSSVILANRNYPVQINDLSHVNFAYNGRSSLSGYRTIRQMIGEPEQVFAKCIKSGSHRQSARLLADNQADIIALDAVCWHWLQLFEPNTADRLYEVAKTPMLPALPFITALDTCADTLEKLRDILVRVTSEPKFSPVCSQLAINGCSVLDISAYQKLENY